MFSGVLRFCSEVRADFIKIRTTFVKHDYDTCLCVRWNKPYLFAPSYFFTKDGVGYIMFVRLY